MRSLKRSSGFTLVEIMIVVAIIALLAAIAIPNLLRAKISANDALAKATLRSISTASEAYATSNNGNYPTAISALTPQEKSENNKLRSTLEGYSREEKELKNDIRALRRQMVELDKRKSFLEANLEQKR